MKLSEVLYQLVAQCEAKDIRFRFEYDTGRVVSGEHLDLDDPGADVKPEHIIQGPRGWRVEVNLISEANDDGAEILYPDLNAAVSGGWRLLMHAEEER